MRGLLAAMIVTVLLVAACDQADEPELTTTSTTDATTTTVAPTTTTVAPTTTTSGGDSAGGQIIDDYDVVVRSTSDDGPVLWIVVPEAPYTDVDLEQFVSRLVEEEAGVWEIHVFDDPAALEAGRIEEGDRTDEEAELVDAHYLVSLTEGVVLDYHGPYEDSPGFVLGS
jgi:hypothetical protein